jgi:hypothetical protein
MKRLMLLITMTLFCSTSFTHAHMPDEKEWARQIEQWQERMKTMHEQMNEISRTQDPQERQKLLAEHWQTMSEQMDQMNMMGGPMMGHGMMRHGMMAPGMMEPGALGHGMMAPGTMGYGMMGHGMMGGCMMGPGMMGGPYAAQMYGMMHEMMHHHVMMMHGGAPRDAEGMGMHKGMHEDMHLQQ